MTDTTQHAHNGSDPAAAAGHPAPSFAITGVEIERYAAAPTLRFALQASDTTGREIYTIALTADIQLEPARRKHDDATRVALEELFGAPDRWAATTHNLTWAHVTALVPTFTGTTGCTLRVECGLDLEIAAHRYLAGIRDGTVPLAFHFSGTVLYCGDEGRMQIVQVPWDTADFQLPIAVWRDAVEHHHPHSEFIRLHDDTLGALARFKIARGLASFDAAVDALLREVER